MSGYFESAVGGFLFGIFIRSFFAHSSVLAALALPLAIVAIAFSCIHIHNRRTFAIVAVGLLFFSGGIFRLALAPELEDSQLTDYANKIATFTGIVSEEPDIRENSTRLTVDVKSSEDETLGRVLIFSGLFPEYAYGDEVSFQGKLVVPGKVRRDGDVFAYDEYLAKDNIFFVVYQPKISLVSRGGGNPLKRVLFGIKNTFLDRTLQVIPEPEGALAGGLTVGARRALGADLLDDFVRTGLIHIVVLSGFNLTIIADGIRKSLGKFSPRVSLGLGTTSIILFTIMTGAGPATVRAAIMAVIVIAAKARAKTFNATRALLIAGFLMVLVSPKILVFDRGFQLSFLATMGLLYLALPIEKKLTLIPEKIWIFPFRSILAATISAQIAVFPWLLYVTGNVSIIALVTNILVLPLIPTTMALVALTGLTGFFGTVISLPFAWLSFAFLWYELFIVKIFAKIPLAAFTVEHFPLWATMLLYAGILAVIWKFWRQGLQKNQLPTLGGETAK